MLYVIIQLIVHVVAFSTRCEYSTDIAWYHKRVQRLYDRRFELMQLIAEPEHRTFCEKREKCKVLFLLFWKKKKLRKMTLLADKVLYCAIPDYSRLWPQKTRKLSHLFDRLSLVLFRFVWLRLIDCLRADVSYFLCCTRKRDVCVPFPRAIEEIGDVCKQASWLSELIEATHSNQIQTHSPSLTSYHGNNRMSVGKVWTPVSTLIWRQSMISFSKYKRTFLVAEYSLN